MGKFLIIKVGKTLDPLLRRRGDFEDWVVSGMVMTRERVEVADVFGGASLPSYDGISGIVIPGSHETVTENQEWSERTAAWLPGAIERNIPILGICYGHQLLAYALGGEVGNNPKGREFGTVRVNLHEPAQIDPLFRVFSSPMRVHVCHAQSVLRLPEGAIGLASSDLDSCQAFSFGGCAWGVQFHPEFDAEIITEYIENYRRELDEEGRDPDQLIRDCVDTPYGSALLRRFAGIADKKGT